MTLAEYERIRKAINDAGLLASQIKGLRTQLEKLKKTSNSAIIKITGKEDLPVIFSERLKNIDADLIEAIINMLKTNLEARLEVANNELAKIHIAGSELSVVVKCSRALVHCVEESL